ncbi:MAG: hypothetical protein ACI9L6_001201 [Flavobacterium sp.]|jgi:hypothetical protein
MNLSFPIDIEKINFSINALEAISNPHFTCSTMQVNEDDFYLDIHEVASYRVREGNEVQIFAHEKSDLASIQLFLNGSILGAILHQRAILPFHGSCFELSGKGILLCGVSGAGKSSVTAAFCQDGATFINDDITPVEINELATTIIPIKTRIKLWDDSLKKLKIKNTNFDKIRPTLDKFYIPFEKNYQKQQVLNHVFILGKHNKKDLEALELEGMTKFNVLRAQIYRKLYLKGMPKTEKVYFEQLFKLAKTVRVTQVLRPEDAPISTTMKYIKQQLT